MFCLTSCCVSDVYEDIVYLWNNNMAELTAFICFHIVNITHKYALTQWKRDLKNFRNWISSFQLHGRMTSLHDAFGRAVPHVIESRR